MGLWIYCTFCFFFSLCSAAVPYCDLSRPYVRQYEDYEFGCVDRSNITVITVSHGGESDEFWWVVEDAVLRAGNDLRVSSYYRTTEDFDLQGMADLIYDAIEEQPDGLVVSMPDATYLEAPVKAAIEAGIPVITMNSGSDVFESLGALHHVGQVEDVAGYRACQQLVSINPDIQIILFLDHESGLNAGVNLRGYGCQDFVADEGAGRNMTWMMVSKDQTVLTASLVEKLEDLDAAGYEKIQIAALAVGSVGVKAMVDALEDLNYADGSISLGTFDFSADFEPYMDSGTLLFAIDQQQYLQGYLPVLFHTLYTSTRNLIARDYDDQFYQQAVFSGPQFVTADRVTQKACESSGVIYCDDPENAEVDSDVVLKYYLEDASDSCPCIDRSETTIGFIHHGGQSDTFWWVVEDAALQAKEDMGITLDLRTPALRDDDEMFALGEAVLAESPDGFVLSIANSNFRTLIEASNEMGIPVVSINSGDDVYEEYGASMHIGQPEWTAGYQGAAHLAEFATAGFEVYHNITNVNHTILCLDHEAGTNAGVNLRCNATRQWLLDNGGRVPEGQQVHLDGSNPTKSEYTLKEYVDGLAESCPSCTLTGMIGVGGASCLAGQRTLEDYAGLSGNPHPFYLACFDTGNIQTDGLVAGNTEFAIDQQQWLQGYLPVVFLALKAWTGNFPAVPLMLTGPGFLQADDVPYKTCENLEDENTGFIGWEVCPLPDPFDTVYERIPSGLSISVHVLSSLLFVVLAVTAGLFHMYRKTVLVKASTLIFCHMMLFFMTLMLITANLFVVDPSEGGSGLCWFRPWLTAASLMGVLAPLFSKTYRLAKIFNNTKMKKIKITNKQLMGQMLQAYSGVAAIITVWFIDSVPMHREVEVDVRTAVEGDLLYTTTTIQSLCMQKMLFVWLCTAYILAYVLYGCYLAYMTRNVPEAFNESKWIAVCLYFFLVVGALICGMLAIVSDNRTAVAVLCSFGLMITVITLWGALFGTKLILLFKGQGNAVVMTNTGAAQTGTAGVGSHAIQVKSGVSAASVAPSELKTELEEVQQKLREVERLNLQYRALLEKHAPSVFQNFEATHL